ncbi:MAG: Uridine monophosphate kinase, partial [uncultured Solirubrobacteraceae bacterium]
ERARLQADPAQAERGVAHGRPGLRHGPRPGPRRRPGDQDRPRPR